MAGNKSPETIIYPGMETTMTLADGTVEPTVDLMNAGKVGVDAISPRHCPTSRRQSSISSISEESR